MFRLKSCDLNIGENVVTDVTLMFSDFSGQAIVKVTRTSTLCVLCNAVLCCRSRSGAVG